MRDTQNLLINGTTAIAVGVILLALLSRTFAHADVGGLMLDYHLDHQRIEEQVRREREAREKERAQQEMKAREKESKKSSEKKK